MKTIVPEKWQRPLAVSQHDIRVNGQDQTETFLPAWNEIPSEFRQERGEACQWVDAITHFFFCGARNIKMTCCDGITQTDIMPHLKLNLRSFDSSHERKTAGCAWLLSLWVTSLSYEYHVGGGKYRSVIITKK
jgi:hypothetical protein